MSPPLRVALHDIFSVGIEPVEVTDRCKDDRFIPVGGAVAIGRLASFLMPAS